ncbi:hypothetical protein H0H81_002581 [Sphagnurus paluster]|uniref:Uncharacterized protein n=1 Tax=Sphagnurus paluster TaxID=117069 RepID=A0A9P7KJI0_9AGAR|nr:hypothetical protein H0H81_002581 [Sphagnurus paluster]
MRDSLSPDSERSIYFDAMTSPQLNATAGPSSEQTNHHPYDVTERDPIVHRPDSSLGWLPATDTPPETEGPKSPSPTQDELPLRRSASRRSMFTNTEGQPIDGSTFIGGAATTGPSSTVHPNQELKSRAAIADASLTSKERSRIAKSEAQDSKRLSKIIREEGRAEKEALKVAIQDLAVCQKVQAAAVKKEARALTMRNKVQAQFQKQETLFIEARTKFEAAQARLNSEEEAVEDVRSRARDATEKLQEKAQEVDGLRVMYGVDERERSAKLAAITGKSEGSAGCVVS